MHILRRFLLHVITFDFILLKTGGVISTENARKYKREREIPRMAVFLISLNLTVVKSGVNNDMRPIIKLDKKHKTVPQKRIIKIIPNIRSNVLGRGMCSDSIRVPKIINKITFRRTAHHPITANLFDVLAHLTGQLRGALSVFSSIFCPFQMNNLLLSIVYGQWGVVNGKIGRHKCGLKGRCNFAQVNALGF
jgi:hypothetical protein